MSEPIKVDITTLREKSDPFPPEAFQFVREGLAHTVDVLHGDTKDLPDDERHVSGQQLCLGLRDFAIRRYGMLAITVLSRWGVNRTDDFGKIVFAMIESGQMRKTDEDTLDDFRGVYDFGEAFSSVEVG